METIIYNIKFLFKVAGVILASQGGTDDEATNEQQNDMIVIEEIKKESDSAICDANTVNSDTLEFLDLEAKREYEV